MPHTVSINGKEIEDNNVLRLCDVYINLILKIKGNCY